MPDPDTYYRCEITRVGYSSDGEAYFGAPALALRINSYPVVARTAKTVVIMDHGVKRRIYTHACRSWAKPSQAQALQSLKLRRKAQVRLLSARLALAQHELGFVSALGDVQVGPIDLSSVPSSVPVEHNTNLPCHFQP